VRRAPRNHNVYRKYARFGFFEANSLAAAKDFIVVFFKLIFLIAPKLMKNKLSVALFTAAFYNFNRKVINYSYFAPGIDVDSSFASGQKKSFMGQFLSRKNNSKKNIMLFGMSSSRVQLTCMYNFILFSMFQSYIIFPK
jgi:hypothetical protein